MTENIDENVCKIELLLREVCFKVRTNGRSILSDFNITPPQFDALQYLIDEGGMTISELSSKLFLAPSTITDLIDRMEKNKLVIREKSTEDRRLVKVKVLSKGYNLIDNVINIRREFVNRLLEDMPNEDRIKLVNYLQILNK